MDMDMGRESTHGADSRANSGDVSRADSRAYSGADSGAYSGDVSKADSRAYSVANNGDVSRADSGAYIFRSYFLTILELSPKRTESGVYSGMVADKCNIDVTPRLIGPTLLQRRSNVPPTSLRRRAKITLMLLHVTPNSSIVTR